MPTDRNFREFYGWVTGEDEAKAVAKTSARRIERSKKKLDLIMPGNLSHQAGGIINLTKFREQLNGRYKIMVVTHSVSRAGWITSLSCEGAAKS